MAQTTTKSSISDFKSTIARHGGFAKANRFAVEITDVPGFGSGDTVRDLSFMCESVSIPGKQITTVEYDNGTQRPIKIPTGVIDDDVAITFNLTNNYVAKNAFDAWIQKTIDSQYLLNYADVYSRTIGIYQLDEKDNIIYEIELKNAYPFQIGAIELANASESTISTVTVTFACDEVITPQSKAQKARDAQAIR
jgi:hypothetical protein